MIEITCSNELYIYNAYHITKSFFPGEDIHQRVNPEAADVIKVELSDGTYVTVTQKDVESREERREKKHVADVKLYHAYETYTGRSISWGLLTGVRPTKIVMSKLAEGRTEEEVISWFEEYALVSSQKARLAVSIAKREQEILEALDYEDGFSLYVGIPFCPSVCSYCSFSSGAIADWAEYVEGYLDALCRELTFIGTSARENHKKLNTIYIGGGTPTTLSAGQLERLLTHIDETFSREFLLEYTIEAGRPDSITKEKLQVIKSHKVTRISINPQTMQQKTLDVIGRKHTVEDIKDTFKLARELGFDNINMDLIAGLPGEHICDMQDTLAQIQTLAPDSLTVHSLAIKRAAKMGQEQTVTGKVTGMEALMSAPDKMEHEMSEMTELAAREAESMNLQPYYLYRQKNIAGNFENVGYAKVDKAGIYNILIMEEKQSIIAAGAGASTKVVLKQPVPMPGSKNKRMTTLMRVENVKDIKEYIGRIDEMIERKGEWLWR